MAHNLNAMMTEAQRRVLHTETTKLCGGNRAHVRIAKRIDPLSSGDLVVALGFKYNTQMQSQIIVMRIKPNGTTTVDRALVSGRADS